MRVDMFTTIHKGVRAMLFELAVEAARVDLRDDAAVAGLVARVTRTCTFLDEHAHHEDVHIVPALRRATPEVATALDVEHRMLETIQAEVTRVAGVLATAPVVERGAIGGQLVRLLNRLIAAQLAHMGREETDANEALWGAFTDPELAAIREGLIGTIPPARYAEWRELLAPALNPIERGLVLGGAVR